MRTPEGKVKEEIKRILRVWGAQWYMPVSNGMGAPALDFIVNMRGRYLAIEAKAPGKKPTTRQQQVIEMTRQAGGIALVVDGSEETLAELTEVLARIDEETRE